MTERLADDDVMKRALLLRRLDLAVQSACTCAWPVETLRNMSGHAPNCPAHALFLDSATKRRALMRGGFVR